MKSLEIVNERIESTLKAEDKLKMELQLCFYKDEAQQIKQDLEVLEILRKYIIIEEQCFDYDLEDGGTWIDYLNLKDINLNDIDDIDPHWRDDLKKVKQWLEENENE